MSTKIFLIILAALAVGAAGWWYVGRNGSDDSEKRADGGGSTASLPTVPEEALAVLPDGGYVLDPARGELKWEAKKKLIVGYTDRGVISLAEGSFEVADSVIVSGNAAIDMNSIAVASTGRGKDESRLARHLKSPDFFDASAYPTARIVLTKSEKLTGDATGNNFSMSADLTIKGITNPIKFPAKVYQSGEDLVVEATIVLDRSKWDVRYGSETFFDNLGNDIIENNFTIYLKAIAVKKAS
ncbi:MAG: YceI family protein [Parcubacteria group bacterium]|nr:YceI family protein [Parcubacteria group bacterium]